MHVCRLNTSLTPNCCWTDGGRSLEKEPVLEPAPLPLRISATAQLTVRKWPCNNRLLALAGVAELADAPDSKSGAPKEREGSTPSSSTMVYGGLPGCSDLVLCTPMMPHSWA